MLAGRVLDQLDQGGHAQPVIQGLGQDAGPGLLEAGGEGGAVANLDLAITARADVDAQAIERDGALAFSPSWSGGSGVAPITPGTCSLPTSTGLPTSWRASMPPTVLKAEEAFASSVDQHEADLIHVGQSAHAGRRAFWPCARPARCPGHLPLPHRQLALISSSTMVRTSPSSPETAQALHRFLQQGDLIRS